MIEIDRDKTAQLGLTMSQVGASLGSLLGGGYVNYFSMQTRSYKVIPQVERISRLNPDQLLDYPIANDQRHSGAAVDHCHHPPRNGARNAESLSAAELGHAGGRAGARRIAGGSAEVFAGPRSAHAAAGLLRRLRRSAAPVPGQESGGVMATFGFAIIIVFLALAALFESFRDPLVILISVPLSIAGALIFIAIGIGGATLEHLHAGGPRDAHRPDQQARHSDRGSRE